MVQKYFESLADLADDADHFKSAKFTQSARD